MADSAKSFFVLDSDEAGRFFERVIEQMADGVRFELTESLRLRWFSRLVIPL